MRLEEKHRQLAADHWVFALGIARSFGRRYPRFRLDWDGIVAVALCHTARKFRTDGIPEGRKGIAFRCLLRRRLHGACLDAVRLSGLLGKTRDGVTVPRGHQIDEVLEPIVLARSADREPIGWELEAEEEVLSLTRVLHPQQRDLVRARFLDAAGRPEELARRIGVCESRIFHVQREALDALRRRLGAQIEGRSD